MENLRVLRIGDSTPQTDILQTALSRAGFTTAVDGRFGEKTLASVQRFQSTRGLTQDGVVGEKTWSELLPYATGYTTHIVKPGDTFYKIAAAHGTAVSSIKTANPGSEAINLQIGEILIVPLWFDVVPVNIRWSSIALAIAADGLAARYPFVEFTSAGRSVMDHELLCARIGGGSHEVFYNASHHANEWITTPVLMKFLEEYARAYATAGNIFGIDARALFNAATLFMMPLVNPDGVDLVTGELTSGTYYDNAKAIAEQFPDIPFPNGWKANIEGIDTNLQYPANWEKAREIKYAQGFTRPAPRDFAGTKPLQAPEPRAVSGLTLAHNFRLTLSYHTQGRVIFWKYLDMEPEKSREIGEGFSAVSGYTLELTPPLSAFAGYKDWFIQNFDLPGYTIEAGNGENPLPLDQFGEIYQNNIGILTLGLIANKR